MFLAIRSQLSRVYSRMAAVLAEGDLDSDLGGRRGRYRVGDGLVIGPAYRVVVANVSVVDVSRWQRQGRAELDEPGNTAHGAYVADRGEVAATRLFKCFDTRDT